ncbi:bactofilin family protein [Cecembia rubra]|uniref:Polymer-forming protein n=1 Tax=Cecembia rubra TaxID=1485585 RepID=A0A2P8EF03_9BACT|nr:polymer-forming cytoskeletal protein [Cecembia rubra]PSL08024.1 polymer-forming protein [Cecembia rubra]
MHKPNKNIVEVTILAREMKLRGDLQTLSDIRIEGEVIGSVITLGKVIISEDGSVTGDISANSLEIYGKCLGNLTIDEHVVFGGKSQFEGEVSSKSIEIIKGSKFLGKINSNKDFGNLHSFPKEEKRDLAQVERIKVADIKKFDKPIDIISEVAKNISSSKKNPNEFNINPTLNGFF